MTLAEYLAEADRNFDPDFAAPGRVFKSPGYHTRIPDGAWVHPTREGLRYAVALLAAGEPDRLLRAEKVFARILSLQDTDPTHETYGIWPWLIEEPLEQMARPDWNWADFCGAELATALILFSERLSPDSRTALRAALGHAARAIVRRNVGPGYTNIAVAGAAVTVAAGEVLGEPDLVRYGRQRLQRFLAFTREQGGFNEYNSPPYGMVTVRWLEWIEHLVRDAPTRRCNRAIHTLAWESIAEHFHPGTHQWAGPHSRAYADRLAPAAAEFLAARTGIPIPPHPAAEGPASGEFTPIPMLPAPQALRSRFRCLPEEPLIIRRCFIRRTREAESTFGTTWFSADACLGSVNHDTFWVQRRPLIGYWRTETDPAVVFRVRLLHDGRDFASGSLHCDQAGPRFLLCAGLLTNQGDWHPGLDRPADAVFLAQDFRVRFELRGAGVSSRRLAPGRFELAAGARRLLVYAAGGRFDSEPVRWEIGRDETGAFADAVWYSGPRRRFAFRKLPEAWLIAAGECLGTARAGAAPGPRLDSANARFVEASWEVGRGLRVRAPRRPVP